jgi:pimeloyl-ACP methyl ester carboxylesterase
MGKQHAASLIAGLALAGVSAGLAHAQPQAAAVVAAGRLLALYASTKDSARLPDGRTLHMMCMGQGKPVVILTAGSGDWSDQWYKVQPKVAEKTRVCAWDRAGFGLSSPAPPPQTVDQRTTDLQAALKANRIKGPYVVVGHSLGGFESLLLKDREPSNVVGMVLVDPAYPGQLDEMERTRPAEWAYYASHPDPSVSVLLTCAADLRVGAVWHGKPDPDGCMTPRWPAVLPAELRAGLVKAEIEPGPETYAAFMETQAAYQSLRFLRIDSRLAIKPGRNYGDMPLIVLTAGVDYTLPPDAPAEAKAEIPTKRHPEWVRAHDDLAALSTRGVNRIVPDSPHYIHQFKPQLVIDAIDEVVDAARDGGPER